MSNELKNDIPAIPERPKSKLDFDPKKDVYIVKRIKKFRFKKMALEYLERYEKEEIIPEDIKKRLEDFINQMYKDMRDCLYSPKIMWFYLDSVDSNVIMAKIRINFYDKYKKQIKSGPDSPLYIARKRCKEYEDLFTEENKKYNYIFKEALRNEMMLSERSKKYRD